MLYLLQEGPAQTSQYMIAGFVVIFGVMALYLVSLFVRNSNFQKDLQVLKEIEDQS
jgi:hypothetical protein